MKQAEIFPPTVQKIRTLGLYQPFAGLMLHGKIETRMVIIDKKPPFPLGKYLIYSTKKKYSPSEVEHIAGQFYNILSRIENGEDCAIFQEFGKAICIGDLVDIIDPVKDYEPKTFVDLPAIEFDVHHWPARRRVGLRFENIQRIKPFPFNGKQGVGFLSEKDKLKIELV